MADNAGTIKLGIKIDDSGMNAQVEKAGKHAGSSFTNALKGAFSFAIGQNIFDFITNGFRNTVSAAFDFDASMQSATTNFTTLLHSASKANGLVSALNEIDRSSTLDMDSLSKAAQEMISFGVSSSSVIPTIRELSDVSQGDSQKFNALSLAFSQTSSAGKLMGQDLLQYIAAGFNPLQIISQKTGKSMSELREEMSKGKISAAMVADAFKTATSAGGKFYNATANSTHTFKGQMAMLKASTTETLGGMIKPAFDTISNNVLPRFNKAMGTVSTTFSSTHSVIQAVSAGLTTAFGPGVGNTFKVLATAIKGTFGWLIDHKTLVISAITGIAGAFAAFKIAGTLMQIKNAFANLSIGMAMFGSKGAGDVTKMTGSFRKLGAGIQLLKNAATSGGGLKSISKDFTALFGLPPQALLVIAAIAAIAALAVVVIKNWGPISGFFKNLWAGVSGAFVTAWNGIKGFFTGLWTWMQSFFSQWGPLILTFIMPVIGIPLLIRQHWGQLTAFFTGLWNGIRSAVMAIVTPFAAAIQAPFNMLKLGLSNILNGIKAIFSGVWTVIKNVVLGIVLVFIDLVTGNFNKLHSDLSHILNNIRNAFSSIWNGIRSVVTGIAQALAGGLGAIFRGGAAVLTSIGNGLRSFFAGLWNGIRSVATGAWNGLIGFFRGIPGRVFGALSGVGGAVRGAFSGAINFIKGLPRQALQWGRDIINGIVNGIKSAANAVRTAVGNVAQNIRSFLHFSRPDVGPLVDYESWMPDMMKGMAQSIANSKKLVLSAMQSVTSGMAMALQPTATLALAGASSGMGTQTIDNSRVQSSNVVFNGRYSFNGKQDIDYFMNQAALLINRKK